MTTFKRRLAALESKIPKLFKPWVRVIQGVGESREKAQARWEAENGRPLSEDDCNIIWRVIVAPKGEIAPHG